MLHVDYTRRAETIVDREEAAARRARISAAEAAYETARAAQDEVDRRKAAELKPHKALKLRLNRLLGQIQARIERENEAILAIEARFDPEWEAADDAVMQAHDAWTQELMK